MSTDPTDDGTESHEPGPPTVEEILADAREKIDAPPVDPSYGTSSTPARGMTATVHLPYVSTRLKADDAEALGLDTLALAKVAPSRDEEIALIAEATADEHRVSVAVDLDADEARSLALQLLASAATVDDEAVEANRATRTEEAGE